jgi:hypothetical protein
MNAVKALLIAKGITLDERHGVSRQANPGTRTFGSQAIKIHPQGILSAASIQILDLFPVRTLVLSAAYQDQNSAKEESQTHLNRPDQCRREARSE